jgi:hypothetical protein
MYVSRMYIDWVEQSPLIDQDRSRDCTDLLQTPVGWCLSRHQYRLLSCAKPGLALWSRLVLIEMGVFAGSFQGGKKLIWVDNDWIVADRQQSLIILTAEKDTT